MAELKTPTTPSRKRNHAGDLISTESENSKLPQTADGSSAMSRDRSGSEAPSSTGSSLTELTNMSALNITSGNSSTAASKKRKLTFAEREVEKAVRKREQEAIARARDEDKARRDEEKRQKAEEKEATRRLKEVEKAEKEAARKAKDAERAEKKKAKDAEKEEREAEKLKKEKAQMRLGSFFGRPAPTSTPPLTPENALSTIHSRRSSITSVEMGDSEVEPEPLKQDKTAYTSWILPFFPHEHTEVAPVNRFLNQKLQFDSSSFVIPLSSTKSSVPGIRDNFPTRKRRNKNFIHIKTFVSGLSGTANAPIDIDGVDQLIQGTTALDSVPYKVLSFREDVRPPYQGTYTRAVSAHASRKLSRRPTSRALPDTNYDYDSEAEWQEPEPDDEDLGDEDEMSEDEDDAEEIVDFLDDEDDIGKRKVIATDVMPLCTGLCWEGESDLIVGGVDLRAYRLEVLHDSTILPINPYSTNHWAQPDSVTPRPEKMSINLLPTTVMQPPRLPLSTVNAPNVSPLRAFITGTKSEEVSAQKENQTSQQGKQRGRAPNPDRAVKMVPTDVLPAFKAAIEGSDLNKVALTEILKKKFPKLSKDVIKDTLSTVAVRQGLKEVDKRWVLVA